MRVWVRGEGTRSADGPCVNDTVGFWSPCLTRILGKFTWWL